MTSRKKRLLFDVLDRVFEPADEFDVVAPKKKKARRKKKSSAVYGKRRKLPSDKELKTKRSGDFNVSIEKIGAIAVVVIMMIAVAYQLGLSHGEGGVLGNEPPKLSRSNNSGIGAFDRSGNHYAIKAATLEFSEYTVESAKRQAEKYLILLQDNGYGDATPTRIVDKNDEKSGRYVIWVGRADSRKDLYQVAVDVRSLQSGGTTPFLKAYIALFSGPDQ